MDVEGYFSEATNLGLDNFKRLNDTTEVDQKNWKTPVGSWNVSVVRGKVLEKATVARAVISTKHPDTGKDTRFDALQFKAYPASPKIPVLLFVQEHLISEGDAFSGMVDVAPAVRNEEDLRFLGAEAKKITEKHGEDYEALRKKMASIYKLEQWEKPVNAGVGIHMPTVKERFELIKEMGLHWLRSYFSIVEKRQGESYSEEDVALRDAVQARILEYYLLGDRSILIAVKLGVPTEPMTLSLLGPNIRY
jgi:coproporphyrinogen III oxidase